MAKEHSFADYISKRFDNNIFNSLSSYIEEVKDKPLLYNYLLPYTHGPKCTFYDFKCKEPCIFGSKHGIDRIL